MFVLIYVTFKYENERLTVGRLLSCGINLHSEVARTPLECARIARERVLEHTLARGSTHICVCVCVWNARIPRRRMVDTFLLFEIKNQSYLCALFRGARAFAL